jgi:hypothetical protein
MSIIKYTQYGKNKNSLLVGVTHNHKKSLEFISSLFSNRGIIKSPFDVNILELNIDNYFFLKKNKFVFSEFYPILKNSVSKIELIDMKLEREIKNSYNSKVDLFNNYLQYNLDKFIYYKLRNALVQENLNFEIFLKKSVCPSIMKIIHEVHILKREEFMINRIKEISKNEEHRNILIVIGISHFDNIKKHVL